MRVGGLLYRNQTDGKGAIIVYFHLRRTEQTLGETKRN